MRKSQLTIAYGRCHTDADPATLVEHAACAVDETGLDLCSLDVCCNIIFAPLAQTRLM